MNLFGSPVKKLANKVINSKYDESQKALKELANLEQREEAIPIFMEYFHKGDKSGRTADYLAALRTPAVIEPLLEVFRAAKPSNIEENGWVTYDTQGNDGGPASLLVQMPGGMEKLKAICPPEEYERILVLAHNYGGPAASQITGALADLATPKTIGRLIIQLWNYVDPDRHPSEVQALVKAGKKAHPPLLEALAKEFPDNRRHQTIYRKYILEALKESGDEQCVPIIQSVMESDSAVAGEARAAIEAIARRCQGVEVPKAVELKPKPVKSIATTGDAYIDSCFQITFQEFDDGREWSEMPEARAMTQAGNSGRVEEALRHAEELRSKFPDFYFSYFWFSILYHKQGRNADALNALNDGLRRSRSKYELCQIYGDTQWEMGNLPEAVKWWIKSVVVQVSTRSLGNFVAFLQLSYVAEGLGLQNACTHLRQFVDRIRSGQIRLNGDAANRLYMAARNQGTASMKQAIELLEKEFLSVG